MSIVYLVCLDTHGAHESSGVFSVWDTREGAIAEAERLTAKWPADDRVEGEPIEQIRIAEVTINTANDDARVTWAPDSWRELLKADVSHGCSRTPNTCEALFCGYPDCLMGSHTP